MHKLFAFILIVIVLSLTACVQAAPEPLELTIEMSEYAYEPENITLQVGQQVTLHVVNSGQLEHELMIGRDLVATDNRPNGYQVDFFESAGVEPVVKTSEQMVMEAHGEGNTHTHEEGDHEHEGEDTHAEAEESHTHEEGDGHSHEHSGFMVSLPQGSQQTTLTFTVTEDMVGEWEMGCFLQDGVHYDAGMHGTLVVKP